MSAISAVAMAGCLACDYLTGASSKKASGTEEERAEGKAAIINAAASILSQLPPEEQFELAQKAAKFLSKQPELRMVDFDEERLVKDIMQGIATIAQSIPAPGTLEPVLHQQRIEQNKALTAQVTRQ